MYGIKSIFVQQKSGNDINEKKNKQEFSEGHHALCFVGEKKNFRVYLLVPCP